MTFIQFQDIFLPYTKYCSEQTQCQHYCRERHQENEVFTAYLAVRPPDHSKLWYFKHAFFAVLCIISVNIKIMLLSHKSLTLYTDISLLTTLTSFVWSFCSYCQVYTNDNMFTACPYLLLPNSQSHFSTVIHSCSVQCEI